MLGPSFPPQCVSDQRHLTQTFPLEILSQHQATRLLEPTTPSGGLGVARLRPLSLMRDT